MSQETNDNKDPSVGSIYFDTPKDAAPEIKDRLKGAVKWFADNKIRLSISIKPDGAKDYVKYKAFINTKKTKPTQPDMNIKKAYEGGGSPAPAKPKVDDSVPF